MFTQLTEWMEATPGKVGIFRDTAAEHLAPYGQSDYAPGETNHPTGAHGCQCSPFDEAGKENNKARMLAREVEGLFAKFPRVKLLPWYDLTEARHDMHEAQFCAFEGNKMSPGGFCCDCTHFCYTPVFWRHFFSRLYDILEEVGYDKHQ